MLSHTGEKRCLKKLQHRKRRDFFNTRNRKKRELVLFPPEIASLILNFGGPFFFFLRSENLPASAFFTFSCASRSFVPCVLLFPLFFSFLFFLTPGCNPQGLIIDQCPKIREERD